MRTKKILLTLASTSLALLTASVGTAAETAVTYKPNPPPMEITLPKMKRGYVDGPYGQVHYQDGGKGRPLVLLHQAPMSSRQFEGVFQLLIDHGIRPIAIDYPGFGMSDVTTFVPRVEDYAKVVPPVLDALGIKTADILGHHTGALVATEVEQQFPDRVRKLILAGPFPVTKEEQQKFLDGVQQREIDFVYETDGSHLLKSFASRYRMYNGGGTTPDPKLITRYTVEKFVGQGPFWYGHHAAFIYDHKATIPKIRKPTLILINTGDQLIENAKLTKTMRPDFELAIIEGGGMADVIDQLSRPWSDAVARFLAN
ncbi:alpha/beta hydrolase [Povalibacter sp.]|uniref:alpha/beta fold hydrolase n=1 Tax=Povalibacter sp. TaxID=1962978 RepID=UPI002F3EBDC9